jgi:hypothetical protein
MSGGLKMKTKVIASFLIYCFIFQIPFMSTGCTSFYPVAGGDNIANYLNYEGDLLLKLKDGTEIEVPRHGIFYIEQDKIDSDKIVEYYSNFYGQYWMEGDKKSTFNLGKTPNLNLDTTANFYFVLGNNDIFRQIFDNDIAEFQIQKVDDTKTTWLFVGVICLIIAGFIIYIANEMQHMFSGLLIGPGGKI